MRGADTKQATMFSIVSPERMVRQDHPLRVIKAMSGGRAAVDVETVRRSMRSC
jgi:hypothetical protein